MLVPNTNNTFVLWTDNRGCGNFFKLKLFILLDIEKGLLFEGFNCQATGTGPGPGIGDWDRGLGLGTGIGVWDWGLGMVIGDWGSGLGIGNRE